MPGLDPGSLDRLHDIVEPAVVPWWPPGPGWFIVFGLAGMLLAIAAWRLIRHHLRNRYRREALKELDGMNQVADVATLVKRVALLAWPREQVASLTGPDWLAFLDASGRTTDFTNGPGRILAHAAYHRPAPPSDALMELARRWIRHHRC
jgi:hypothetical protein